MEHGVLTAEQWVDRGRVCHAGGRGARNRRGKRVSCAGH